MAQARAEIIELSPDKQLVRGFRDLERAISDLGFAAEIAELLIEQYEPAKDGSGQKFDRLFFAVTDVSRRAKELSGDYYRHHNAGCRAEQRAKE